MPYIYCITNQINGKQYVGKTTSSVKKRFKQHCLEYKKERCEKRPLYNAMSKYGIENFIVEPLIQCNPDELNFYEEFFISKLNTYHNGYNATKGGDGKILFDYQQVIELYKQGLTIREVANKIQSSVDTVSKIVHMYNLPLHKIYRGFCQKPKRVARIDKNTNEILQEYNSYAEAGQWLVDNGFLKKYCSGVRGKIGNCCAGTQKIAYKFKWKNI